MATATIDRLERRAEILQAARATLAEKGLEATKISEIVARAGVAQGTFYLYFPSKSSLVMALAEEMNTDMLTAIQHIVSDAGSLAQAIADSVRVTFQVMGRYRDVLGLIHSRIGLAGAPDRCAEMDKPFHGYISSIIRQGQSAGAVNMQVEPDIAARLIVGLIEHAGDECYVYGSQIPTETYVEEVARFIQSALGVS